ncbi:MAG TPA: hypothetical protein VFF78_01805 [Anaerolineaceae bacterium]|nr:hypothetical protein [Anaerolineaceae bacterium]
MKIQFAKRAGGSILAMVLVLSMIGAAAATPGDLDPTFGTAGKVMTRFGSGGIVYSRFDNNGAWGASVALSDGKYLVAGEAFIYDESENSDLDIGLARFNADGSEDTTLGGDGAVSVHLGGTDSCAGMLLQPDGKILVVGTVDDGGRDMLVARFNSEGTPDATFGTGGWTRLDFSTGGDDYDNGYALALQGDGKIVAVGKTRQYGTNDWYFAVARFTATGTLDSSFGTGGIVTTGFGMHNGASAYGIAIQGDGKIVVVGTSSNDDTNTAYDIAVARYTSAGAPDTTFSGDGKLTTEFGAYNSQAFAVGIQSTGNILVAGYANNGTNDDLVVLRYSASDGSLDTTFSGDGIATQDLGEAGNGYGYDRAYALEITGNNILVTGATQDQYGFYDKIALARFTLTGALDTTFNSDGFTILTSGRANDVMVQGEQILLAGTTNYQGFFLARLNNDGNPDTEFAATAEGSISNARADALAVQPDGKIVAAGYRTDMFDISDFALARFNADGTLDTTFGADGKVITSFGPYDDDAFAVALQQDGKIVVAGQTENPVASCAIARYNSNGSLDTSFDTDGMLTTVFAFTCREESLLIQPDGKIVLAGQALSAKSYPTFTLARFNSDSSPDNTFGGDGSILIDFGEYSSPTDVAIQPDGKLILVGYVMDIDFNPNFALARFNSDGTPDTLFGTDGKLISDFGENSKAAAVGIQSSGKIIVAGTYETTGNEDWIVARYNSNGALDTTFDSDGMILLDFGGYDALNGLSIQLGDKIVLAGEADVDPSVQFGLARLNADGTIDTTFSTDGMLAIPFLEESNGRSVAIQSNGMIVVAGHTESADNGDFIFALARIEGDPVYTIFLPAVSR